MADFVSKSTEQTEKIGADLGKSLKKGDIVAFFGEMGAGKTAFIRGMAAGLGLQADVSSPTFALVHEYEGNPPLYHFDMYRVNTWEDLYSTGFFDYLDSGGILAVEWCENIESALPEKSIRVEITKGNSADERHILIMEDRNIENSRR